MKKILKGLLLLISLAIIALIILLSIFTNDYSGDAAEIENCNNNPIQYSSPVYLDGYTPEEINGSTVYALSSDGTIKDSTTISLSNNYDTISPDYSFDKYLSTGDSWKIVFKKRVLPETPEHLLITNIKTKAAEERTMTGHMIMCYIYEWEVNGKKYKDSKFKDGDKRFILGN